MEYRFLVDEPGKRIRWRCLDGVGYQGRSAIIDAQEMLSLNAVGAGLLFMTAIGARDRQEGGDHDEQNNGDPSPHG